MAQNPFSKHRRLALIRLGVVILAIGLVTVLIAMLVDAEDSTSSRDNGGHDNDPADGGQTQTSVPTVVAPVLPATPPVQFSPLLVATNTAIGPESALVTIVEYGTYGCYACRQIYQLGLIEKLLVQFPRDIRYVYIPWPVIHPNDKLATQAVYCAYEQGAYFWAYHNALFDLSLEEFYRYDHDEPYVALAATMGLDVQTFYTCLSAGRYMQAVFELIDQGAKIGLEGTPAFFVNGALVSTSRLEQIVLGLLYEKRPSALQPVERE